MARILPSFPREGKTGAVYGAPRFQSGREFATSNTGSARGALPTDYELILVFNDGPSSVYLRLGDSSITVNSSNYDVKIPAGSSIYMRTAEGETHIAANTANAGVLSISGVA